MQILKGPGFGYELVKVSNSLWSRETAYLCVS